MVSALMKVFALPLLTARRIVSFLGIPADVSEGSVVSAVVVPAVTPNWRTSGVQRGYPQHPDDMLGGYKFTNEKDKVCFESAAYYGATAFINYRGGSIEEQVMDITGGHGVDRVIVAGGEDEAISIGVKVGKLGGTVSNVKYFSNAETLPIPRSEWGAEMAHKTIDGGLVPEGRNAMQRMINLVINGRVDPTKMITHRFEGFEKIEDALFT